MSTSLNKLLLSRAETQVNIVEIHGQSALIIFAARHDGGVNVVSLLLAHPKISSTLVYAASNGHDNFVKLLRTGIRISVNLVGKDSWSALMRATSRGHDGVVKLFISHPKTNAYLVNKEGWSALMIAANWAHHKRVVWLLLEH